jgi:hypothetical protein
MLIARIAAVIGGSAGAEATETKNVTVGDFSTIVDFHGYDLSVGAGSIDVSNLNGETIGCIRYNTTGTGSVPGFEVQIDIGSDPGQDFFASVRVEADGSTFDYDTASADTYAYGGGIAQWQWLDTDRWADEVGQTRAVTFTL